MPWQLNMVLCIGIGFGCFIWAIFRTMGAEKRKHG